MKADLRPIARCPLLRHVPAAVAGRRRWPALLAGLLLVPVLTVPAAAQSTVPPGRTRPTITIPDCLEGGMCLQVPPPGHPGGGVAPGVPIRIAPPAYDPSLMTWSNSFNEGLGVRERETSPRGQTQESRP